MSKRLVVMPDVDGDDPSRFGIAPVATAAALAEFDALDVVAAAFAAGD